MVKIERDLRKRIEASGLTIVSLTKVKGHYHTELENADGVLRKFTFSGSPSDYRATLNDVSYLRRFAREAKKYVEVKEAPTPIDDPQEGPPAIVEPEPTVITPATTEKEETMSQQTRDPSHAKGTGKITRNVLPQRESYRLCQLLEGMDLKGYTSAAQLVAVCQDRLELPLTEVNIRTALKTIGKSLTPPKPEKPMTPREKVLVSALLGLYRDLGKVPPADLADLRHL